MAKTRKGKKKLSTKSKVRRAKLLGRGGTIGGALAGTAVGGWPIGTIVGTGVGSIAGRSAAARRYRFSAGEVKNYKKQKEKKRTARLAQYSRHHSLKI